MVALFWETALLLLAAYFIGAFLGCMIRRLLFPGTLAPRAQGATAAAGAAATTAAAQPAHVDGAGDNRFSRALTGEDQASAAGAATQAQADAAQGQAGAAQVEPVSTQLTDATTGLSRTSDRPQPSDGMSTGAIATGVAAGVAAAAAGAALSRGQAHAQTSQPNIPTRPEETVPPQSAPGSVAGRNEAMWTAAAMPPGDDLENISGIDGALAEKLKAAGVNRFEDIAGWTAADVAKISATLGLRDEISRQNWIEQAAVLAKGNKTAFAKERAAIGIQPVASPSDDAGVSRNIHRELGAGIDIQGATPKPQETVVLPAAAGTNDGAAVAARIETVPPATVPPTSAPSTGAPTATAAALAAGAAAAAVVASTSGPAAAASGPAAIGERDDLTAIAGITPEIEKVLNGHGISRISQIAGWSADDVRRFDGLLGSERIAREDWVGQAQRKTGTTLTTASFGAAAAAGAAVSALQGMRSVRSSALVGDRGANRPSSKDDLKRIRGIGVLLERRLNSIGIESYEQIAGWDDTEISRVSAALALGDQIQSENWVAQARLLSGGDVGGGTTARASTSSGEINRSVPPIQGGPSEALDRSVPPASPAPAASAAAAAAVTAAAAASELSGARTTPVASPLVSRPGAADRDDLKRIRGVGILIERKLNELGVTSYNQIANWTANDIERVNAVLDFDGRIERENWIEQARILASGGQTEFSRRMDRGDA